MMGMIPTVIDPPGVIRAALKPRTDKPKTQTQLAADIGLTWPQWQNRMYGRVAWRLDELQRIAETLDIPLTDLIAEDAK